MAVAYKNTVAAQQARFGATAGLYTLVVIGILVAVNYLGVRFNKPIDLTSNKRFTLSEETQKIVGNLKQDATITYFDTSTNFDQAKGILDRYKNLSTKIHVDYVDLRPRAHSRRANMACVFKARLLWKKANGAKKPSLSMSRASPARF